MSHSSEVGTVQPGQEMGPVNDQAHIGVSTANGENALPAHRVPGAASKEKGGRAGVGDAPRPEFPLLDRLAEFVPDPSNPDGGTWEPVTAGSVGAGNSTSSADNTYVIAHGWMPGYRNWADKQLNKGVLPTSWETWQGPNRAPKAEGPSTPWLYKGSRTDLKKGNFAINDTGLAESILAADPKATVLAYSWIDESATPAGFLDIPEDPFVSEAYTTMNGMRMAEALTTALAPNYGEGLGKVNLIGHSHGVRVATVAAVALQQAAAQNPRFNVVGQLTLLDSPENNTKALINPVDYDAANFDWFYLAQLNIAPFTTTAGTTGSDALRASPDQSGASPIFVDNFVSYVGTNYGGFTVNDPDQGIDNKGLSDVVDVNLDATKVLKGSVTKDGALWHEYAANWYAGSESTRGTQDPVGLMWSPLISGGKPPTALTGTFTQEWASVDAAHQFVLTPAGKAAPVTPVFTPVTLGEKDTQGDVKVIGPPTALTGVTLVRPGWHTGRIGCHLRQAQLERQGVLVQLRLHGRRHRRGPAPDLPRQGSLFRDDRHGGRVRRSCPAAASSRPRSECHTHRE